jgi:ParB family chromosome partitioning protein
MIRNIKYKSLSKDLEKMTKPNHLSKIRASVGLDNLVREFFFIDIKNLIPFSNQARKVFNSNDLDTLADSIKQHGIRQPLTVIPTINNQYEVVSGERRLRAAKIVGLEKVPCIIINTKEADVVALIENIHRKDLHLIELGMIYKSLLDKKIFNTQQELAHNISVSNSHISECLKYAGLNSELREQILKQNINSRDKIREILSAQIAGDTAKLRQLLNTSDQASKNNLNNRCSFRINFDGEHLNFNKKKIKLLTITQKRNLKKDLNHIIESLEI